MRRLTTVLGAVAIGGLAATVFSLDAHGDSPPAQHSKLLARSVLPAATFRAGSPPSGALFSAADRTTAAGNGIPGPATGDYFANQPVQGISDLSPAGNGTWWAVSDNGYGTRQNSPDWQLVIYRIDPRFGNPAGPQVLSSTVLSDPDGHVPWKIVCDQTGQDLPPFDFNALPARPAACDGGDRILTGFDFDPESLEVGSDGSFWIGDEFGPFLLNFSRDGHLLAPPYASAYKAPQNPTLNVLAGEKPVVGQSRGWEGLAISPDRRYLYPLFEGPLADDDIQTNRILEFDTRRKRFTGREMMLRLEMPGGKVNLAALNIVVGGVTQPAYPGSVPPPATAGYGLGDLTSINDHQLLFLERDGLGDGLDAPRFKKVFVLDIGHALRRGGFVSKSLLVDLLAVPDPQAVGNDGAFFRFPFNTIESVHVVDRNTIISADDNNFPFSNGRSRSKTNARTGPLAADDNEIILIQLGTPLDVDKRLLKPPS